ncbi:MAG: T9SS type A sorting domain-containing protein [Bacteroidales bacterium]|nr:T9SS type A sorting domain-containing protein [Bacteroidales bacterium]
MKNLFLTIAMLISFGLFSQTQWQEQNSSITNHINSVYFSNLNKGWAVGIGGKILNTPDGGYHWAEQTSGTSTSLYDVFFVNNSKGWAVGNGDLILATNNGGSTWSQQSSSGYDLSCIQFIDENTGFAAGETGAFKYTTNGGSAWTDRENTTTYPDANAIHFFDANNGLLACNLGKIYKTSDQGVSWTQISTGISNDLTDVCFPTPTTGYASAKGGKAVKTTDGGNTWTEISVPVTTDLLSVSFVSEQEGYVCGSSGKILYTNNGGTSWEDVSWASFTGNWFEAFALTENLIWMAGASGTIIRKDTWDEICMVTVDHDYNKNKVVWEKVNGIGTEYYNIYKLQGVSFAYQDSILFTALTDWVDWMSNPAAMSAQYKISCVDSFGNESPLSNYHQTINLINTYNATTHVSGLIWNPYVIEDGSFLTDWYYIYRGLDDTSMELVDSVSAAGATNFNDNDVYEAYFYYIGVNKASGCAPTGSAKDVGGPYQQSVSNLEDTNLDNSIEEIEGAALKIYPNPATNQITISLPKELQITNYELRITDITGKLILLAGDRDKACLVSTTPQTISNQPKKIQIDISGFEAGVYFVEVAGERVFRGKVVIN